MDRRSFLGGAVSGVALAVGGRAGWDASRPPAPPPPPPPEPPPCPPSIPEHGRISFSQQGEDIVLYHAAKELLKLERPTYMDVGAAYPVKGNNTYLLYSTGGRGVLVEPNPALTEQLRAVRPGDIVVQAGIGVTEQAEADYYEIKGNPMLNTFSPDHVAELQKDQTESVVERVVKMPLLNINAVIAEHLGAAPDILSTDVEGLDLAILRSLDMTRFRPAVICAETLQTLRTGRMAPISAYLTARGYIPRGGSLYNTIYVDRRRIER